MYIIEGNIGAGKTTFLHIIKNSFSSVAVVDEPLDTWHNQKQGQSLLANFYKDAPRWAFTMEMFTLMCRIHEHVREQKKLDTTIVMERSIYSGYYCFARNSHKQGFMTDLEWNIHERWFHYLIDGKCAHPTGFIYLQVSPDIACKRTKKRSRSGEDSIPLAYFKQIDKQLQEFLIEKKDILPGLEKVPVLTIDCNEGFAQNKNRQNTMLAQVAEFFAQTQTFFPARSAREKRKEL